ncbi:MAG TPA: ATP-binding protein [Blastocatellia bacterium]|nr:ATP-binding protein [Blastocatellia bacterium]
MNLENFISDALSSPVNHIWYSVSRKLAELFPEKIIIEGSTRSFGLEAFVRAGHCSVIREQFLHNQTLTEWHGIGNDFYEHSENVWLNVLWQNQALDVILMTWGEGGCKSRQHWIMAETRQLAEDFFRAVCHWCDDVRGEVLVYDGGYWAKSEALYNSIKSASFDNLILPDRLKREIREDFARFFTSRELYEKYAIPWKRGVLFIGPPGNGKTHTVKAVINQMNKPCLYVKSLKSRYDTDDDNIRQVFYRARQITPCLVVLEDLDSIIDAKSRSFFLNEMDGFAANTGIVVLATTNYPERLDPAILDRPSRFDRKYYFGLPEAAERARYIEMWNGSLQPEMRLSEAAFNDAVVMTEGFSFAYLKELFLSSMMQWMASMKAGGMDVVVADRAASLREQMSASIDEPPCSQVVVDVDEDDY